MYYNYILNGRFQKGINKPVKRVDILYTIWIKLSEELNIMQWQYYKSNENGNKLNHEYV